MIIHRSGYIHHWKQKHKWHDMGGVVMKQKNGMPLAQAAAEDIIEIDRKSVV